MAQRAKPSNSQKRVAVAPSVPPIVDTILIGQSKLRRQLNVSPMTFWRWLHDEKLAFPASLRIKNRVYFRWADVEAWLARQQAA
jgi:predicted DNA-binding transcriptional regulator AlpA